ncbi:hypothetical protein FS749_013435 [Ceratobasidium sp. UAMH 11750]|nr:hypothetical protein FS749_013435 [Ceratobasidium sp. UAMH 11750]
MLAKLYDDHPGIFDDLMGYFNTSVLPDVHQQPGEGAEVAEDELPTGLSQRDIDFMENW